MKRNILWLGMLVMVLALSVVFTGCGSSPKPATQVSPVPAIDYSLIGPDDSVILAYLDPQLVETINNKDYTAGLIATRATLFNVLVDDGQYFTSPMSNVEMLNKDILGYVPSIQSDQIQIPNGTYTLHVLATKVSDRSTVDILPFEVAFDNVAITYKIRPATNAEKEAGGIGVGNEAYTMEEVAQVKLR